LSLTRSKRGNRAIELGLSAEDLIAVEEFAACLRNGESKSTGKFIMRVTYIGFILLDVNKGERSDSEKVSMAHFEKLMDEYEKVNNELSDFRRSKAQLEVSVVLCS
jgi:hypothetical protein